MSETAIAVAEFGARWYDVCLKAAKLPKIRRRIAPLEAGNIGPSHFRTNVYQSPRQRSNACRPGKCERSLPFGIVENEIDLPL